MSETLTLLSSNPADLPTASSPSKGPIVHKKKESILWRGLKVAALFFYEMPFMVVGLAVAGIASHIFCPIFAGPLYALTGSTILSKLVIKVLGALKCKGLSAIERAAWRLKEKFPKIRLISLIFVLAVGYVAPIGGIILAIILGGYNGSIMEIELCKKEQETKKKELEKASQADAVKTMVKI